MLLLHGLGGSWRSWRPVLGALAAEREVIAVDLPGFGKTPALPGEVSIGTLADTLTEYLDAHGLTGVDVAGSSMGARLALELARRGVVGATVSLDPGGFWSGWQKGFFYASLSLSIRLVRLLQPVMPIFTGTPFGRQLLFSQLSAHPERLPPTFALEEMRSYAAAPSYDELLYNLVYGPAQQGATSTRKPIVIGWGRKDMVCFASQASRVMELFPTARMHWFDDCGHFPQWDHPGETARLILDSTG